MKHSYFFINRRPIIYLLLYGMFLQPYAFIMAQLVQQQDMHVVHRYDSYDNKGTPAADSWLSAEEIVIILKHQEIQFAYVPDTVHDALLPSLMHYAHDEALRDISEFVINQVHVVPYELLVQALAHAISYEEASSTSWNALRTLMQYKEDLESGAARIYLEKDLAHKTTPTKIYTNLNITKPLAITELEDLDVHEGLIINGLYKALRPSLQTINNMVVGAAGSQDCTSATIAESSSVVRGNTVTGPSSSTPNAVPRFANAAGSTIQNSAMLVDDSGNVTLQGITNNGNTVSWPPMAGSAGTFLGSDGSGNLIYATPSGGGNVSTASNFTNNNAITVVDLSSGVDNIQETGVTLDGSNNINNVNTLNATTVVGNLTGSVTGNVIGNVTGAASANVLKAGDTMTGPLLMPAGSSTTPSLQIGAINVGLSSAASGLSLNTNGMERINISSGGTVLIDNLAGTAGVVHNDASGNLSSALIVNADISSSAGITDSKLNTISTAGKVANSATTATSSSTPSTIVVRDSSSNFSANTITASLTGAASLNVLKAGDMMTGNLTLPAGSASGPGLQFNGSTNTGISAATANTLSLDTNGIERIKLDGSGNVTINGLNQAGVVHTDATGLLTTSSIVNNDIANGTIANSKLAAIGSTNIPNTLVVRDGSGNFATNMITINGTVANPTDVATKAYVDTVATTGLIVKAPALVASTTNISLSGLQTIDGVTLVANDRVLLVGQTDSTQNGLWLAQIGSWTRPADFATGDAAGEAYVLVTSGTFNAGASWVCDTPEAIIGTDPLIFQQFSLPSQTAGANVGVGTGQVFQSKSGNTLNFKTILAGSHVTVTNDASDVAIATDATNANTPGTLVARDGSGNFSATTITANLTGAASSNVLKAGDTMTGNLTLATQHAVRLQDTTSGNYVGINAPTTIASSYNVSLPTLPPAAGQMLEAITASQLTWATVGGSPTVTQIYYVAKNGNDSNDGSFNTPFLTLAKAIEIANMVASSSNPVLITLGVGIFVENNAGSPLTITASGIGIVGKGIDETVIQPSTLSNDLLLCTVNGLFFSNFTIDAGTSGSTASGINFSSNAPGVSRFESIAAYRFNKAFNANGSDGTPILLLDNVQPRGNAVGIALSSIRALISNAIHLGPFTGNTAVNTGITVTGSTSLITVLSNSFRLLATGISVSGGANVQILGTQIQQSTNGLVAANSSILGLVGCNFLTNNASSVNVSASGAGTQVAINSTYFNCFDTTNVVQGIAIQVINQARISINSVGITGAALGVQCGQMGDTSSTIVNANAVTIGNCTQHIVQNGSSTLNFDAGAAAGTKIAINDSTNVQLTFFDSDSNNSLQIGKFANVYTKLLQASIGAFENPQFDYNPNIYNTQAIGYINTTANPATLFALSANNVQLDAITTDSTKKANIRIVSDTGSPVGGTSALRGWDITKNGTTAELSFQYGNSDIVGQAVIPTYSVLQLDGVNNQVQLPTPTTQLVFATDTNLYRSAANTLKTDGSFVAAGTMTATSGFSGNLTGNVTGNVVGNVTGAASANVLRAGDAMTGALLMPVGSSTTPSLQIGSTTIGLSSAASGLSFNTNGAERINISSGGTVLVDNLAGAVGIVHNDASGNLSSALIVNSDISPLAAISDSKLANISSAGKVANSATTATSSNTGGAIVARDSSGNFSAGTITASLTGASSLNVLKAGDAMTGSLTLPAGSAATPALQFNGSTNTGISAATANTLSFDTNGNERMNLDAAGNVTISGLNQTGVVHTSATGLLTTSSIVNNDITDGTIANSKLAAIASTDTPGSIVVRDISGNFATNMITIDGTVTNPTDVATKAYVDTAVSTGLVVKAPALVASTANVTLSGLQTIDGIILNTNDRVLLVGQTDPTQNGLWLAQTSSWTRPADFATSTPAGEAYVLVSSGNTNAGASWVCTTPNATIDTDPLIFQQFSLPSQTAGANVGVGAGQVFQSKSGNTLNFKTILAGTHVTVTNDATDVAIGTDATNANTPSTIVARDSSGNFSATTITGNLTGAASLNVLKSGDTMTGNLNLATQNALRLQDTTSGNYVGLNAAATIPSSYTVSFPSAAPTAGQILEASTPTQLAWITSGGSPAVTQKYYVAKNGNDSNDGSFNTPFLTLAKAIGVANSVASSSNLVAIQIGAGVFVEDNSAGPLTLAASGISIIGLGTDVTIVQPSTLSNALLLCSVNGLYFGNFSIDAGAVGTSTASGIVFSTSTAGTTRFESVFAYRFLKGFDCQGSSGAPILLFDNIQARGNGTTIALDSIRALIKNSSGLGPFSGSSIINTGITVTGATSLITILSYSFRLMNTGLSVSGNAQVRILGSNIESVTNGIVCSNSGIVDAVGCNFVVNNSSSINVAASGAGTRITLDGVNFDCRDASNAPQGTAIQATLQGTIVVNSSTISGVINGIICGQAGDTSSTVVSANATTITNVTQNIIQNGSSSLNLNACTAAGTRISINDSTNVQLAFFDTDNNNALQIGKFASVYTKLLQASIGATENPQFDYNPSFYNTQAIGYVNTTANPASLFALSANDVQLDAITTDSTKKANIRLASDTGSPVGGTSALRGWDITKNGTTAELAFQYRNSDSVGQAVIPTYSVLQLDGVNNQVQLPTSATQLVFATDTNLYRSAANTLKTDDSFVAAGTIAAMSGFSGNLTGNVTGNVVGNVTGAASANVLRAGDTMTGALLMPAGSSTTPSLQIGANNAGLSSVASGLSLNTNGAERINISSSGTVLLDNLAGTAGVVHNDASGNLSSSLIVNADISGSAGIADSKLNTISTAGKVANSATTATSSSTPSTIVARDSSNNFSANTITANLTGAASLNVLKAGDTMTGNLNLATQNAVRLQDTTSGNYVGLNAASTVPSSYTVSFPTTAPTAGQILEASTPTQLTWITSGGSPVTTKKYYVAKNGNDSNDGSFNTPFLTIAKAISVANTVATTTNLVQINVGVGTFIENNSAGPIAITASGISIVGQDLNSTRISPSTPSNDLLSCTVNNLFFSNFVLFCSTVPSTANAIVFSSSAAGITQFDSVQVVQFLVGFNCTGGAGNPIIAFNNVQTAANATGILLNNIQANVKDCTFRGPLAGSTISNTGITATGSSSLVTILSSSFRLLNTAISMQGNANARVLGTNIENTNNGIVGIGGAILEIVGCNITLNNASSVNVSASGAGTQVIIDGTQFACLSSTGTAAGIAVQAIMQAKVIVGASSINGAAIALQCGQSGDTSSTIINANGTIISNGIQDIVQNGSSTLIFTAGTASGSHLAINDATNVQLAFFDADSNNSLQIGKFANVYTKLLQASIGATENPQFDYNPNIYNTQAIGYINTTANPATLFALSANNVQLDAITTDSSKKANVRLVSDTGSPVGGTSALRGWDITKNGTTAELSFQYQNSDSAGQSIIPTYSVLQLDGVNNQVQLPTPTTQLVFAADTNLYRSAASTLKTDNSFIASGAITATSGFVGNLTGNVTGSLTGNITGAASANVLKVGDTMTGTLILPGGSTGVPSLQFNGSTNTGISAAAANTLSFDTSGNERMKVDASGNVTINGLAQAGIVHTSATGLLTTSSIVNADIADGTIANSKLGSISSTNTPGAIVVRDSSGNFVTNMITIQGTVTNPTDVATKSYVDTAVSTGLVIKAPALVASTTNIASLSGLQTIDGVTLVATNRVLLVGQTSPVQNGLWLAQSGSWTRPVDFATGTQAGEAYVLVTSGTVNAGASWVCTTPSEIIDADPLIFQQFSLPSQTSGANVGTGAGQVFQSKSGNTLNFKTILAGAHITVTDDANDVAIGTDATDAATPNTAVARNSSGNFSASNITANLIGAATANVLKAGDTMTGALLMPVGSVGTPALQVGANNIGLCSVASGLSCVTNGLERLNISSTGTVLIDGLAGAAGILHNDLLGNLSSSLIVNADINAGAAIADTKLATIATANKVLNSATTATNTNTINTIVARDGSGNFTANIISAALNGAASANVLKAGDTMTGALLMPAGSAGTPALQIGTTNVGLASPTGNLILSTNGIDRFDISSGGTVTIKDVTGGFSTAGILHNDTSGSLSSSFIVNADVDPNAAIADSKLATIATAGKIANSATTATNANTVNAIVARDGSGNFIAGTITAALAGAASANVLKTGDAMTGVLLLPAGTTGTPALQVGTNNVGLSSTSSGLSLSTGGAERINISSAGTVLIDILAGSAGVVHSSSTGSLTNSLIVNADISASAAIADSKLATISTAGKVANSATTATNLNTVNAIVSRDASGNFIAGTITAALVGAASANVLKTGDTMTGALLLPAGTTGTPALQVGTNNVGLSSTSSGLSLSTGGVERLSISSTGTLLIDGLAGAAGVLHNDLLGNLSSSLVVNADISSSAAIVDSKLATIATAGKVANSATTATSANTASALVARDSSGNFIAGTITANLTGAASSNVLKAGDTMTGALLMPTGSVGTPALQVGATNIGISAPSSGLSLSTNGVERLNISSGGTVLIDGLAGAAGVLHNDVLGNLSTSLVVNADISAGAAITDSKLATISTAGKVANSATTAASANTVNAIVARDSSGNFTANIITGTFIGNVTGNIIGNVTGNLTGSVTGSASLNVLKAGDTMTGSLTVPAGTAATPSIQFTGSTNTGISVPTANTLSFDTNGVERMNISTAGITMLSPFIMSNLTCIQGLSVQSVNPASGSTVVVNNTTSILLLAITTSRTLVTITFPPSPVDGQLFTILLGGSGLSTITLINSAGLISIINGITSLSGTALAATTGGTAVTYYYSATNTNWYRLSRG